ncbi:hypothetical protein N7456_004767 [Penicillium angulare]|uniref:Uncharacterized protein n=1 Tax=Penicillium angulare TaxID=116970 RepID=A0A9W9KJY0_9EURO|nr:hypothetical protein N7456_004767 [Penicillium angulare]
MPSNPKDSKASQGKATPTKATPTKASPTKATPTKGTPTKKETLTGSVEGLMSLTVSEARLILLGAVHHDGNGKIDFEKVAERTNVAPASARRMHLKARSKLLEYEGRTNVTATTKTKRKATDNEDEEGDGASPAPPTKKPRGRKPKQAKPEPEVKDENGSDGQAREQAEVDGQLDDQLLSAVQQGEETEAEA